MRILAIDTATENCSAALRVDECVTMRERLLERGHAEVILPMVDEVLAEAGVALTALTAIAFGRGPGAFTGVRLAASVAQGLAFGAGVPVVPVSDLRALAQRAMTTDAMVIRVLACTDARMREVYWGCFERSSEGLAGAMGEEHVGKPATVALPQAWCGEAQAFARPGSAGSVPVYGAGPGFAAYPELRRAVAADTVLDRLLPRASEIAQLAVPEVTAGRVLPAERALPVYLRDEVAQRRPGSH